MGKSQPWRQLFPLSGSTRVPLLAHQVAVNYGERFCRASIPGLSERIEAAWRKTVEAVRSQKRRTLFDEPKFRLSGIRSTSNGILLELGPTSYKEYIAFRTDQALLRWAKAKAIEMGIDVLEVLPNVLGNVGLVMTKDLCFLGVIRSEHVYTYKGYLDLPGGHPEPLSVEGMVTKGGSRDIDLPKQIRDELFGSVLREIEEEIGLSRAFVEEPRLVGILANLRDAMKPDMVFVVQANLISDEIEDRFLSQTAGSMEVGRVVFFDSVHLEDGLGKYRMTPIMAGSLALVRLARQWLEGLR